MVIEYSLVQDPVQSAVTAFITVLALVAAEFMSGALDEPKERKSTSRKHSSKRNGRQATSSASRHHFSTRRPVSDITSVDSNSDLIGPRASMTPLEREIAALRGVPPSLTVNGGDIKRRGNGQSHRVTCHWQHK